MKNVRMLVKLRRLVKSLAVTVIILILGFAGSAFKSAVNNDDLKKSTSNNDPLTDKYGFKSLFSNNTFDPTTPHVVQLNPRAVSFVQDYIRREGENLERMKIWGKPYFDMYDGILTQYGLPKELKYLSVIESDLSSGAVSNSGAVGPWQIMRSEAISAGLKVNSKVDERKSFAKSTHAAAKILKGLYSQFNDWLLVIAAYNCGDGRLRQAIKKSGSRDFWKLQSFLPIETRSHVKRFIGTHYIFEGNGGLTTMTSAEVQDFSSNSANEAKKQSPISEEDRTNTSTTELAGKYNSIILAKNIGIDLSTFNKLNPNFDKLILAGNSYTVRLPKEKMPLLDSKKNAILTESVQYLLSGGITSK